MLPRFAPLLLVVVALAGCGTPSFADRVSSLSTALQIANKQYNAAGPTSLAATGSACAAAASALQAVTIPASIPKNASFRQVAVIHAFQSARRGYSACARAAPRLSYTGMVSATREIAQANSWIGRAMMGPSGH